MQVNHDLYQQINLWQQLNYTLTILQNGYTVCTNIQGNKAWKMQQIKKLNTAYIHVNSYYICSKALRTSVKPQGKPPTIQ